MNLAEIYRYAATHFTELRLAPLGRLYYQPPDCFYGNENLTTFTIRMHFGVTPKSLRYVPGPELRGRGYSVRDVQHNVAHAVAHGVNFVLLPPRTPSSECIEYTDLLPFISKL